MRIFREQRSWLLNNLSEERHQQHQRLRAGVSLPSQCSFQPGGASNGVDIEIGEQSTITASQGQAGNFEEEGEDLEEEEENDFVENSYLRRQRKLPYPYRLKENQAGRRTSGQAGTGNNLGIEEPLRVVRRSRSGSPCSISSESTESLGDCENALDPPHLSLPHGSLDGGGVAVPVTCGMPNQYCSNGSRGSGGRKFSVLFSANDTWSDENILQSFKELSSEATGIFEAAWTGNLEQLEESLSTDESLEKLRESGTGGFRDSEGRTPLHLASACGHVECVKSLIEKGAPVNVTDGAESKATPLSCAASCGALQIVRLLLEGGANVNAGYEQGKTALHWATMASSVECAKALLVCNYIFILCENISFPAEHFQRILFVSMKYIGGWR